MRRGNKRGNWNVAATKLDADTDKWVEWQPSLDAMGAIAVWVLSSTSSSSCGICAASGLCSIYIPTFNSGSSSNVSPIFDTLVLHFLVGHGMPLVALWCGHTSRITVTVITAWGRVWYQFFGDCNHQCHSTSSRHCTSQIVFTKKCCQRISLS